MGEERRSSQRIAVRDTRLNSPTLCGRIIDRSPGGLSIESVQALRVGGYYRFTLGDGDPPTRVEGKVLWCRLRKTLPVAEGEYAPIFRAGIALVGRGPNE